MATCERSVAAAAEVATWKSQLLPEFGLQPLELSHETEHQLPFLPLRIVVYGGLEFAGGGQLWAVEFNFGGFDGFGDPADALQC